MIMPDTEATQYLLYTPYTKEYSIPQKIRRLMPKEVFFDELFLKPPFLEAGGGKASNIADIYADDYVEEANDGHSFEFLDREEVRQRTLNADREQAYSAFINWINNDGNSAYIIKGDAGAGKTTFIHYIEWLYDADEISFDFVDIREARRVIKFSGEEIRISDYGSLASKAISALLSSIMYIYLPPKKTFSELAVHLKKLYSDYKDETKTIAIRQHVEVEWFFELAQFKTDVCSDDEAKNRLGRHISGLKKKLDAFVNNTDDKSIVIDRLLDVLMMLVRFTDEKAKKHVICFDNIEKFLHQDEIADYEITRFVEDVKDFIEAWEPWVKGEHEFQTIYQIIVLMRNTSIRVDSVNRAQAEFDGRVLDLTDWFSVNGIVDKKMQWYRENRISFKNMEIIDRVIGRKSVDVKKVASLHAKLSLLFNNDKRLIVSILDEAIVRANATDTRIIKTYEDIIDDFSLKYPYRKMAARSIMIRLVLDVLRDDSFFATIRNQLGYDNRGEEVKLRQSYARKILTYLNNKRVKAEKHKYYSTYYISFRELVGRLVSDYFSPDNEDKRETISKILFAMNKFNRKNGDFIHLIDIQFDDDNRRILTEPDDLIKLALTDADRISVSILDAGLAYLLYIAASFEYFASRYEGVYLEPLFACLPTLSEVKFSGVDNFKCLRIIKRVYKEAESCIKYMRASKARDFDYISPINDKGGISHIDRIKNVHTGYLANFIDCVRAKCAAYNLNYKESKKVNVLITEIEKVIKEYNKL